MNGDARCSVSGPTKYVLRQGFRQKCGGETRVEAGSNTSTVTLRVVGGDEMGSLNETVKYGRESKGVRTRE
jgi:hypothetical protein